MKMSGKVYSYLVQLLIDPISFSIVMVYRQVFGVNSCFEILLLSEKAKALEILQGSELFLLTKDFTEIQTVLTNADEGLTHISLECSPSRCSQLVDIIMRLVGIFCASCISVLSIAF